MRLGTALQQRSQCGPPWSRIHVMSAASSCWLASSWVRATDQLLSRSFARHSRDTGALPNRHSMQFIKDYPLMPISAHELTASCARHRCSAGLTQYDNEKLQLSCSFCGSIAHAYDCCSSQNLQDDSPLKQSSSHTAGQVNGHAISLKGRRMECHMLASSKTPAFRLSIHW